MAHPIENIMGTTMENLKAMIDVSTVVGAPVSAGEGVTVIPVSRVSFGFVAGGGEYLCGTMRPQTEEMPFAGGAGAGVSVHPMGFLVCSQNGVRLLSANCTSPMERIVEMIPQALEGLKAMGEEEDTQRKPSQQVRAAYQE